MKRDVPASRALIQGSLNFREWAAQNKALREMLSY
jgi:hypothetical protein